MFKTGKGAYTLTYALRHTHTNTNLHTLLEKKTGIKINPFVLSTCAHRIILRIPIPIARSSFSKPSFTPILFRLFLFPSFVCAFSSAILITHTLLLAQEEKVEDSSSSSRRQLFELKVSVVTDPCNNENNRRCFEIEMIIS